MKSNKRTYSHELADAIDTYLTEEDWHYDFHEDSGTFRFNLGMKGKLSTIYYLILVHADDYTVYANAPVGSDTNDPDLMSRMNEFINRVNYGLRNGNFEMDMRDGEIRYKSYVDCEDQTPSRGIIENSIHCPAAIFRRYSDGILSVIFKGTDAKSAVEACEKPLRASREPMLSEESLHTLRELFSCASQRHAENPDGSNDTDSIAKQLPEGDTGDNDDDSGL